MAQFKDLPLDVIQHILTFLSLSQLQKFSRVSHSIQDWVNNSRLGLELTNYSTCISSEQIRSLLRQSPGLKELVAKYCPPFNDEALKGILLDQLHTISIRGSTVSSTTLCSVFKGNHSLTHADVRMCIAVLNDDFLDFIAQNEPHLKVLKVEQGFDVTSEGVSRLLACCKRLRHLDLINCPQVDQHAFLPEWLAESGMNILDQENILGEALSPWNLRHLDISYSRSINDTCLWSISHRSPRLRNFRLGNCSTVTDQGIAWINLLEELEELVISGCYLITDQGLQSLFRHRMEKLKYLDISGCTFITDKSLSLIKRNCPCLINLKLQDCSGISLKGIHQIAEDFGGVFFGSVLSFDS